MKTIIVTGGLGFIGSNLINILSKKNFFIINIDKVTYASNFKNISSNIKNYKFYKQDINNQNFIKNILEKYSPSLIFNVAAETHVDRSIDGPKQFINSNIYGVFNILEAIKKYKKKTKLIHVSTDEVYGDIKKNKSSKEYDPYRPSSPYSASKASGDLLIKSYVRTYNLPAIITNCCNNYGPNQYPEKLIPKFIKLLKENKKVTIQGDGSNIRAFLHANDTANAFELILEKGEIGEIYNIGCDDGMEYTVLQIAKILINLIKHTDSYDEWIEYVEDRPFNDKRYYISNQKLKDLGWEIKESFYNSLLKLL